MKRGWSNQVPAERDPVDRWASTAPGNPSKPTRTRTIARVQTGGTDATLIRSPHDPAADSVEPLPIQPFTRGHGSAEDLGLSATGAPGRLIGRNSRVVSPTRRFCILPGHSLADRFRFAGRRLPGAEQPCLPRERGMAARSTRFPRRLASRSGRWCGVPGARFDGQASSGRRGFQDRRWPRRDARLDGERERGASRDSGPLSLG